MTIIYNETWTLIPTCESTKQTVTMDNASLTDYEVLVKHYFALKESGLFDDVFEDVLDANHKQLVATRTIGNRKQVVDIYISMV